MQWLLSIKTLHLTDWITRDRKSHQFRTGAAHAVTYGLSHTQANQRIGSVWPEFPATGMSARNAHIPAMPDVTETNRG